MLFQAQTCHKKLRQCYEVKRIVIVTESHGDPNEVHSSDQLQYTNAPSATTYHSTRVKGNEH
jgi:hypothetical protein